jgi:hypothetical protein
MGAIRGSARAHRSSADIRPRNLLRRRADIRSVHGADASHGRFGGLAFVFKQTHRIKPALAKQAHDVFIDVNEYRFIA